MSVLLPVRLSRRSFLLLLPPLAGVLACRRIVDTAAAREALIGLLRRRKACAVIGDAYLAEHPEHSDLDGLTRGLASDVSWSPGKAESKLAAAVSRRVHGDFKAGRVTDVSGWTLADTEVRLCVLVALARPAA